MRTDPADATVQTAPAARQWTRPPGRTHEQTTVTGSGDAHWAAASAALLAWGVKIRSGFRVEPPGPVRVGQDLRLTAVVGPLRVHEPVRVVAVVDTPDRRGFAYATRPGHPVSGEEAFVLHRDPDGRVRLTLRSVTGPGRGLWRVVFPVLLVAQRVYRRRYTRALRGLGVVSPR